MCTHSAGCAALVNRSYRTPVVLIGWLASCGRCRPATTCTRTRAFSRRRRWSHSTAATSKNSTAFSSRTRSRRTTMPDCSLSGSRRITPRPRTRAVGRSEPSASTASDASFPCRRPSGTERRRPTASRRSRGRFSRTATRAILTLRRAKRRRWPRLPG